MIEAERLCLIVYLNTAECVFTNPTGHNRDTPAEKGGPQENGGLGSPS